MKDLAVGGNGPGSMGQPWRPSGLLPYALASLLSDLQAMTASPPSASGAVRLGSWVTLDGLLPEPPRHGQGRTLHSRVVGHLPRISR